MGNMGRLVTLARVMQLLGSSFNCCLHLVAFPRERVTLLSERRLLFFENCNFRLSLEQGIGFGIATSAENYPFGRNKFTGERGYGERRIILLAIESLLQLREDDDIAKQLLDEWLEESWRNDLVDRQCDRVFWKNFARGLRDGRSQLRKEQRRLPQLVPGQFCNDV